MTVQVTIRPVNRNEKPRLHECDHKFQFLLAGMSAHVDRWLAPVGVIDLGAAAVEMVHHPIDGALVSRNVARREDNGIALFDLKVLVVIQCKARQRRHRLALAAAGDGAHFLARVVPNILRTNHEAGWNLQEAKLLRRLRVLSHSPAEKAHHASVLLCLIDDELKSRN